MSDASVEGNAQPPLPDLGSVKYEKLGHVAYVTLIRPEKLNALTPAGWEELRSCWADIAHDPAVYVAIITGTGRGFCAGLDVRALPSKDQPAAAESAVSRPPASGSLGLPAAFGLDKPLIAAINGIAAGAGLSLALQSQLRVMAEDAWLGDMHTKIGRLGAPQSLYASLPHAVAAYLTLCNGRLSAAECKQLGIVNRVVTQEQLLPAAEELAAMVCRSAPRAVQAAVRLYRMADQNSVLADYARHLTADLSETNDAVEGGRALAEHRPPVWTGN